MSINPLKDQIITEAYIALGDLSFRIVTGLRTSNAGTTQIKDWWDATTKIRYIIKALEFEPRLTDIVINNFLDCLVALADIRSFGAAPSLALGNTKPQIIFTQGLKGDTGTGIDGDDATVDVKPKTGEDQIKVDDIPASGPTPRTFDLSFVAFVAPSITQVIVGSTVLEESATVTNLVRTTLTRGSEDVTASVFTPSALDATYQGLLDLATLNAGGLGATQVIDINDAGVTADKSYSADITDGIVSPVPVATSSVNFVYPPGVIIPPAPNLSQSANTPNPLPSFILSNAP